MQSEMSRLKLIGAATLLLAAFLAVLITLRPEELRAPAWVAYLAAGVFAIAGSVVLARAYGRPLLANGLMGLVLGGMMVIGLWIAFGPGARECGGGVFRGGVAATAVSETTCRTVFGVGALVVASMLLLAIRGWLKRRSGGPHNV